jgi:ABC-2 type transport system ATP-binding protein
VPQQSVDTGSAPALRVDRVSRRIESRALLDDITLSVSKGTILGLVGPNGAGKTSLLRAISGRLRVDAGSVTIDGVLLAEARRLGRIGVVPQEIALYPHLTVRENLSLLGRLAGVSDAALRARVDDALGWAGLADRADALAPTLSGGMRRRVNLVASTLHRPTLLILDEPTVGVDADARARLHALLIALRDRGVGVVIATHDLEEASLLCNDVAVMAGGRVLVCDAVAAVVGRAQRELTITLDTDPGADVVRLLSDDGFSPLGARQWVSAHAGLGEATRVEQRLGALSVGLVETRISAPSLAGAIATLTRPARESAA